MHQLVLHQFFLISFSICQKIGIIPSKVKPAVPAAEFGYFPVKKLCAFFFFSGVRVDAIGESVIEHTSRIDKFFHTRQQHFII